MANSLRQDTRLGELITPLGRDRLALRRFDAAEAISEPFEFQIEALSKNENLSFDEAIGEHCSVRLTTINQGERFFDGILTDAQWLGIGDGAYSYRLTVRPWFYLLSKRINTKIFRNKTAPQIIEEIFADHAGLAKFEQRQSGNYPVLEYTVQYRESDMNFVSRLMELHGIAYHFRHARGEHTLIMASGPSGYEPVPGAKRPWYPIDAHHRRNEEHLSRFVAERRFTSGQTVFNDYNFKKPSADLKAETTGDAAYSHGKMEVYDYPARYREKSDGAEYSRITMDRLRSADRHYLAGGDCMSLSPGFIMHLEKHPTEALNQEYLTVRCHHSYLAESYATGSGGDGVSYAGTYEFVLTDTPYVPPVVTPLPLIHGPETGIVVGRGEIDVDEHGRIEVRFPWDRDQNRTMRCRVAQVWAGKNWGSVFIPRVGMEVVCVFEFGNPDRPLVIGCVYNGENKLPYPHPDQKNISGWKSNSTTGGGGYNEFVFDDTKGDELVRLQAEYDMQTTVKHDERHKVENDRDAKVDGNDTLKVGKELLLKADQKITLMVGASKIVMDPYSVSIESLSINVQATAALSTSGLTAQHSGQVMLDLKAPTINLMGISNIPGYVRVA